uniref:Uncharacterized protein n=1 Tax=Arundo donax TaxID=35708 RepID=A0A0A9GWW3_ARUDO
MNIYFSYRLLDGKYARRSPLGGLKKRIALSSVCKKKLHLLIVKEEK